MDGEQVGKSNDLLKIPQQYINFTIQKGYHQFHKEHCPPDCAVYFPNTV